MQLKTWLQSPYALWWWDQDANIRRTAADLLYIEGTRIDILPEPMTWQRLQELSYGSPLQILLVWHTCHAYPKYVCYDQAEQLRNTGILRLKCVDCSEHLDQHVQDRTDSQSAILTEENALRPTPRNKARKVNTGNSGSSRVEMTWQIMLNSILAFRNR